MMNKITTYYAHPPIPDRNSDWIACYEGLEEYCEYGYGATKEDAVKNLEVSYG